MKHYTKKAFLRTLIFAVILIVPTIVNAQFAGGNGTEANPYQIATAEQLSELAEYVNTGNQAFNNKYYKLISDIDLSAYGENYNGGKGWIPIGTNSNPFMGYFDGNNKIISNLYINNSSLNHVGLFGHAKAQSYKSTTIKKLGIENGNITGHNYVGGIAGLTSDNGDANYISISNSYFNGSIIGNDYVGGITGCIILGAIFNSYSIGNIINGNDYVGGITGSGTAICCYSTNIIEGNNCVGGICGSVNYGPEGSTYSSVALNASVKAPGSKVGRIYGESNYAFPSNNAAWDGMLNNSNNSNWYNIGPDNRDGEDMSSISIHSDGTLGGRFLPQNGWKIVNGKLPGLFGNSVDFPEYLLPTVPSIITVTLPDGTVNEAYNQVLDATNVIAWSLHEGNLPSGLTLSSAGVISGTPSIGGVFTFTVMASNDIGNDTKEFTLTIMKLEGATVTFPSLLARTHNSIFINPVAPPNNGQTVEYAINTVNSIIDCEWQTLTMFDNLMPNTVYYVFARSAENETHYAGEASTPLIVPTEIGINVIMNDKLIIYPNPTKGELRIDCEECNIKNITIFDANGKVHKVINEHTSNLIDISHLLSGIYFVKIHAESGEIIQKIVKINL